LVKLDKGEDPSLYSFSEGAQAQREADIKHYGKHRLDRPKKVELQHLWCQHCKALRKSNETVVECWYNPLDADQAFAFCAANEDAIDQILALFDEEYMSKEGCEECQAQTEYKMEEIRKQAEREEMERIKKFGYYIEKDSEMLAEKGDFIIRRAVVWQALKGKEKDDE